LAGIDIYSLAQAPNGDIWIGTNDGLRRYDGYQFYKYDSENMRSKSLFGLKLDNEGTIYCNNLVGQIFSIQGDSIELKVQIPDRPFD